MSGAPARIHCGEREHMRRRDVLAAIGGIAIWPGLAQAQQRRLPVIGYLYAGSFAENQGSVDAFRKGLAETGYVEGRNVAIVFREARNDVAAIAALARDLVRRRVDVIVVPGSGPAALAAKAATDIIPIVFSLAGDPVALRLVESLSRPGGNVTGITDFGNALSGKRLELIKLLIPTASRIAILATPSNSQAERAVANAREGAQALGLDLLVLSANTVVEIDTAFATLAQRRADAFSLVPSALFVSRRTQIIDLAARYRVPAMYPFIQFAEAGGLMSYGSSLTERNRQSGTYTGLILNGARPADLPVRRIERFELVINMKTAQALGLAVPPSFLALADKVIE